MTAREPSGHTTDDAPPGPTGTGTARGGAAVTGDAVAVVVVRDGIVPVGADEAVAEAGGTALLV
ncbi:hypothetical protein, partial [Saccharomonospora iraqiensis]|uniref:hypothetical protein n=1 Tax=Saccharomonospora iraqiensis TaxID=52698 RepID=UPI000592E4DB